VEDRRRKGVKTGHHEVTRRVVGLLDDVRDLAVLVRVTDAVPPGLLPGDLLDEERRVRAVLALPPDDVL